MQVVEGSLMNTSFADAVLNITVTGMLVRIDLGTVTLVTGKDGKQERQTHLTQQLVMPLEGFAQAFSICEQLVNKLVADGILKKEVKDGTNSPGTLNGPITLQ